jgi:tRNA1(Val) A37 N6-methylase TrmN6
MSFRPVSTSLHDKLSKEVRQKEGIFFTPVGIRERLFEILTAAGVTAPTTVLEPSFGSGEFLFDLADRYPAAKIHGVELNRTAFLETGAAVAAAGSAIASRLVLTNTDFLKYGSAGAGGLRADLIVGNPPYFVTKQKDARCVTGRSNIFVLFLYKCLTEHLAPGGILAFVLPRSFYNCCYYDPCRRFIAEHMTVLAVEDVADAEFYDTAQDTMLFVVREGSGAGPNPYVLTVGDKTYINPHAAALAAAITETGGATIASLGCAVKTGEVVWNEHKEKLTADPSGSVLVLYSNNIKSGAIQVGDPGKKGKHQYIRDFPCAAGPTVGPAILVARGYGNTTYKINFAVVPAGMRFYGENHVNVITGPAAAIAQIAASLADARTGAFIERFVGNGALSKTELESVLPVWI